MTDTELLSLYAQSETKPKDFRAWAKSHGVDIDPSILSRHRSGASSIPKSYVLAYKWFFSFYGKPV